MAKSAEAFRTISEASKEVGVPQHVLRHWEDVFGHIRPMRRAGGRRYYRPVDIDLLRGVRVLLYDKRYTTKGVQKIFRENGAKYITEVGRNGDGVDPLIATEVHQGVHDQTPDNQAPESGEKSPRAQGTQGTQADLQASRKGRGVDVARLEALIARLETVQEGIDNIVTALDAIATTSDDQPPSIDQ